MTPARSPIELTSRAAVARNLLESRAQAAYAIYAHRIGAGTPWAIIHESARQGWREVVEWIEAAAEPRCPECKQALKCRRCS
jgi:hypothetical protein